VFSLGEVCKLHMRSVFQGSGGAYNSIGMAGAAQKRDGIVYGAAGAALVLVDNLGRLQSVADFWQALKERAPSFLFGVPWPAHLLSWVGLASMAIGMVVYLWPSKAPQAPENPGIYAIKPELVFTEVTTELSPQADGADKRLFLVHFKNNAGIPVKRVFAQIGYKQENEDFLWIDYGAWAKDDLVVDIAGAQSKQLVVALEENGRSLAAGHADRSGNRNSALVPKGELTPGKWAMTIAINADNYQKKFYFLLTVDSNGAITIQPLSQAPW
jgi:hypothetical protein